MLERIFNSELKIKLINLFLSQAEEKLFSYAEIAKLLSLKGKTWRRDIDDLIETGLFKLTTVSALEQEAKGEIKKDQVKNDKTIKTDKTFLGLNKDFFIFSEIKSLFAKSRVLEAQKIFTDMETACHPQLVLLTGKFINKNDSPIDLLVVGNISRRLFSRFLLELESAMGEEINYSIMTEEEFKYRRYVMDIFLYNIINNDHVVLSGNISDLSILQKVKDDNQFQDKRVSL